MYTWKIILEIYRSKTTSLYCPSRAKYYRVFAFGIVDDSERMPRNEGQQIEFVSYVCVHNLFVRDTYGRRRISVVVITRQSADVFQTRCTAAVVSYAYYYYYDYRALLDAHCPPASHDSCTKSVLHSLNTIKKKQNNLGWRLRWFAHPFQSLKKPWTLKTF